MFKISKLILVAALCWSCGSCQLAESETFLVPQGYRGKIYIIFNQTSGQPTRYEKGRRVYDIPATGILLTRFKDDYGIINQQYFYIDVSGNREPLKKIDSRDFNEEWTTEKNPKEPSRDALGVFLGGTGSMGAMSSEDPKALKFQTFFVCTYNELKTNGSKYEKEEQEKIKQLTGVE